MGSCVSVAERGRMAGNNSWRMANKERCFCISPGEVEGLHFWCKAWTEHLSTTMSTGNSHHDNTAQHHCIDLQAEHNNNSDESLQSHLASSHYKIHPNSQIAEETENALLMLHDALDELLPMLLVCSVFYRLHFNLSAIVFEAIRLQTCRCVFSVLWTDISFFAEIPGESGRNVLIWKCYCKKCNEAFIPTQTFHMI